MTATLTGRVNTVLAEAEQTIAAMQQVSNRMIQLDNASHGSADHRRIARLNARGHEHYHQALVYLDTARMFARAACEADRGPVAEAHATYVESSVEEVKAHARMVARYAQKILAKTEGAR